MFDFFKGKVDYEKLFASANETHHYIYGNRSKTAKILGDDRFIEAWLDSKNIAAVTTIIKNEALKGDIPSLKQMIWLNDLYFKDADNLIIDLSQKLKIKVESLKERIMFCEKAIRCGLKDQSYPAMISCTNLYSILAPQQNNMTDETTRFALNGIVKYARLFIESGYDDPELIRDAKMLLKQYTPITQITNSLNAVEPSKDMEIKENSDIESIINEHGAQKAGEIMRDFALNGNLLCQTFLSGLGLRIPEKNRTKTINDDIELFTKLAAEGGDACSQFNLALIYAKKVDSSKSTLSTQDVDYLRKAKYWHEKAVAQGITESIQLLKDIKFVLRES